MGTYTPTTLYTGFPPGKLVRCGKSTTKIRRATGGSNSLVVLKENSMGNLYRY